MDRTTAVSSRDDIPVQYRDTPIGRPLEYHNLKRRLVPYPKARLLIGMCMDHRKRIRIPEQFAYIIRTGGSNFRYSEDKVSCAIAVGGVKAIALIGHNHCSMVGRAARREQFVQGLVEDAGWGKEQADEYFMNYAPTFEIGNEIGFVSGEARRLRLRYPKILVAPLLCRIEDGLLCLIEEGESWPT